MNLKTTILIIAGIPLALTNLPCCTTTLSMSDRAVQQKIEASPQFKNGKFKANGGKPEMSLSTIATTTWEYFFSGNEKIPRTRLPVQQVDLIPFNNPGSNQLNVTWLGHSSLMINIDGYRILMDPVFEKRISLLGPTRFNGEVPLDIGDLPGIDLVLISHDHYDHLNRFSITAIHERVKTFLVPLGVGARLEAWGVPREKIVELDWWEEHRVEQSLMVAATPAQHFSGRGVTDRNKTLWASWVVKTPGHSIYFSGDSGYFNGFKVIGDTYGPFDMTFMECGAYNPAWHAVHMYPEETVQAHLNLRGNILHPIHWGTFNLSVHAWYDPMERLSAAAKAAHVKTATPIAGQTTVFNQFIPSEKWWTPLIPEPLKQKEKEYALQTGSKNR